MTPTEPLHDKTQPLYLHQLTNGTEYCVYITDATHNHLYFTAEGPSGDDVARQAAQWASEQGVIDKVTIPDAAHNCRAQDDAP